MKKGFTLIEILVVVSITVIISSFALVYTRSSQNQVSLQVETQKIASFIFRAKSLAITTYNRPSVQSCGYGLGVNYSARTYRVFSYDEATTTCSAIQEIKEAYRTTITSSVLPNEIVFDQSQSDSLMLVLFVPPSPRTLLSNNAGGFVTSGALTIYLSTKDGLAKRTVTVSPAGQVDL